MKNLSSPRLDRVKSPMSFPFLFNIGASVMRPGLGIREAKIWSSQATVPSPTTEYLAKPEISIKPTPLRTDCVSSATCSKSVERRHENLSCTPSGANQSGTSSPKALPICAPADMHERSHVENLAVHPEIPANRVVGIHREEGRLEDGLGVLAELLQRILRIAHGAGGSLLAVRQGIKHRRIIIPLSIGG